MALKEGNQFDFYNEFSVTDSEGPGIIVAYADGDKTSALDGENLFKLLFTDAPEAASSIAEVALCAKRLEEQKTPTFLEFYGAQITEYAAVEDARRPVVHTQGIIFRKTTVTRPNISESFLERREDYKALRAVYDAGQENIYAEYCVAADHAITVAEKIGVDATSFLSFDSFTKLSSAERSAYTDKFAAAEYLATELHDEYMEHHTFLSKYLTGETQAKAHEQNFRTIFLEPNPKLALEQQTSNARSRVQYVNAVTDYRTIFGQETKLEEKDLYGISPSVLDAQTRELKAKAPLVRQISAQLISTGRLAPEDRRAALLTFINADLSTLQNTAEHYSTFQSR